MPDRRTILWIAAAAAAMFVAVYMLTRPAVPVQPPTQMVLPKPGGPDRRALAQARTEALNAGNEAPPVSEVEAPSVDAATVADTVSPANTVVAD